MNMNANKACHYINGKLVCSAGGRIGKVYNPSTGEQIYEVDLASAQEADQAVKAASQAFEGWAKLTVTRRIEILHKFRQLLDQSRKELAEVICMENGKTYSDALAEIARSLEAVDFAYHAPHLLKGEYSMQVGGDIDVYSIRQPIGVVIGIGPFNFPVMGPISTTTFAMICGNTVVWKASEKVPKSSLYLADLWTKAGLPDGVLNVIQGDKEAVDALIRHPLTAGVHFVGSTRVAEYVYGEAAKQHKRVVAFGGGKNHMVIMPDADMDQSVNAFLGAAYGSASQRCMAVSVAVLVGEKTAKAFCEKLIPQVKTLKVGPWNSESDYGALISREAKENVERAIERAVEQGARVLVDGRGLKVPGHENGFYLGPTLLDQVTTDMDIYKEEVFGPVRVILQVDSMEQAIKLINEHEYGNGVCLFTRDGYTAKKFSEAVQIGMVGINVGIPVPVGYHNFGGWKRSKFGDGYGSGPENVRFFTKLKTISQRFPEPEFVSRADFDFPSN
jgi:malonate-semialdehyde dehydrogenase (acetylating)/methylmalonate-semialdehyde dehydrogenase